MNATATTLKDENGKIKFPRTLSNLVYNEDGSTVKAQIDSVLNDIKSISDLLNSDKHIDELNSLLEKVNNLKEELQSDVYSVENIHRIWKENNQKLNNAVTEIEEEFNKLKNEVNSIPKNVIIIKDEKDLLISSLLATTDMYELMNSKFEDTIITDNIINAYFILVREEIKSISDVPESIQDIIVKKFL